MKIRTLTCIIFLSTGVRCLDLLDEEQLIAEAVFIGEITSRDIQQRLIPDIHFTCEGALTKWTIVASQVGGGSRYPELQIWRRTGSGNEFTKVGRTVFSSSSISTGEKIYEQSVDPPLNFEPGDILGVYTPPVPKLTFKYQKKGGPTNYYIEGSASSYSRFSLNGAGVLSTQNDYPLVSVEVNRTECISGFIDRSTLELKASLLTVNNTDLDYKEATQRVIPELVFTESGKIESFTIGALHRGTRGTKYPEIQLWRAAGDQEWVKVSPTLNTPAISSTSYLNVYQYQLYPPLQVQAGDVLGIYQPYTSASVLQLYYQEEGPLNYYKPAIGSSTNRLAEDSIGIYSRSNQPLIAVIFRPNSPTSTTISSHASSIHQTRRPSPTSRPVIPVGPRNKPQIIFLICFIVVILVLIVVVVVVLIILLIKNKLNRSLSEPLVNQRDGLEKSLLYNATYIPRNPSELITDGRKQVVDLAVNKAYTASPKLEPVMPVEHIYDTID